MPSRRSVAAAALGALLLFPGGLAAQSFELSIPSISIDVPGAFDAPDFSTGAEADAQFNESDFDFVSRLAEEAASGISEALVTTAAGIAEDLEEIGDALTDQGEELAGGISEALIATAAGLLARLEEIAAQGLDPEEVDSVVDELASIVVLCLSGGSCEPPDPPPEP